MNWLLWRIRRGRFGAARVDDAVTGASISTPKGRVSSVETAARAGTGGTGTTTPDAAGRAELERAAAQLRAMEERLRRTEAQRRRLENELRRVQKQGEQDAAERQRLEEELQKSSQNRLWAWAEEEVRRLQDSLKKTRERLYDVEEALQAARAERDQNERRARNAEDEAHRLRDELRQMERTMAASRHAPAPPRAGARAAQAEAPPAPAPPRPAAPTPAQSNGGGPPHRRVEAEALDVTVDWSGALAGVDGDTELLRALARTFQDDASHLLNGLREALDESDWEAASRTLRLFRGALASLGAVNARQVLQRLEASVQARDIAEAEDSYVALQLEIERLRPALITLRGR